MWGAAWGMMMGKLLGWSVEEEEEERRGRKKEEKEEEEEERRRKRRKNGERRKREKLTEQLSHLTVEFLGSVVVLSQGPPANQEHHSGTCP